MSVADFLDSNVFVYLFDDRDAGKRQRAEALVRTGLETGTACISYQVVQEVVNVLQGTLGMRPEEARAVLDRVLVPLWRVNPTADFYRRGLELRTRYGVSFYDSLIVAAALDEGCTTLYSEDLQHAQRIQGLTIRNPFLEG